MVTGRTVNTYLLHGLPRARTSTAWLLAATLLGACAAAQPKPAVSSCCREQPDASVDASVPPEDDAGFGPDASDLPCTATAQLTFGPLLGAPTSNSVKVWARSDRDAWFVVRYWPAQAPNAALQSQAAVLHTDRDFTGTVTLINLQPQTEYQYELQLTDVPARRCLRAVGSTLAFRTLPAPGPGKIRFVSAGDVTGANVPGFADIAKVSPAFVLMIGDNVYADGFGDTFKVYQQRYQAIWGGKQFRALFSSVPAFRIWDDHELVDNYWQGKNDAVYAFARPLYDDYQGSMNPVPLAAGELYYSFTVSDVGFFVMDLRSHRSADDAIDDANKTMLGAQQKQSLKQWLKSDPARVHVLVSPVLVSRWNTTGTDSWIGFSTERNEILAAIHDADTRNLLVISGDQHWSALLRTDAGASNPYAVYEFQTTPLAFNTRAAPSSADSTVLALDNTHQVFGVFDIDTQPALPTIDFTLCAVGAACDPQHEPAPKSTGPTTATVPYSTRLTGGPHGLTLLPAP